MAGLGVEQVFAGQDGGIESFLLAEILALKCLAVQFVNLVELESGSGSKLLNDRTAWAAKARRSTRNSTRRATPAFIRR